MPHHRTQTSQAELLELRHLEADAEAELQRLTARLEDCSRRQDEVRRQLLREAA